ncbi:MAG: hypothetical protein ABIR83_05480 [Nakamurella sp.]
MIPPPDLASLPASMLDEDPAELVDWGRSVLAAHGYHVLPGDPQLRRRAWSTVARVETDRGPVWIKGNARDFGAEAALLVLLTRLVPRHVLPLIDADPVRGRMVTVDGGSTLLETGTGTEDDWIELLTGYADLQSTMAAHVATLRRIGLADMTPPRLTDWYRAALDRVRTEPVLSALLTGPELAGLDALLPVTGALAAELDRDAVPVTVEHNDLHRNNVFAADPVTGSAARIFDWGDAAVTHPFIALGRTLRVAAGTTGEEPADAAKPPIRVDRLRDAYLRRWSPDAEITPWMRRSAAVAEALSQVTMAGSWLRMPLADNPDWARAFVGFLRDYARLATAVHDRRG